MATALPAKLGKELEELRKQLEGVHEEVSKDSGMSLPYLEVYNDKLASKGVFTLDYGDGNKVPLGTSVSLVYLYRTHDTRALFKEGDRPVCASVDGIPTVPNPIARTCAQCQYSQFVDRKPFEDAAGDKCREKRQIPAALLMGEDKEMRVVPAMLNVPPTSLGDEWRYRSAFTGKARAGASGNQLDVITRLKTEWKSKGKFEWATLSFADAGPVEALAPELVVQILRDRMTVVSLERAGKAEFKDRNDIAAQDIPPVSHGGTEELPF